MKDFIVSTVYITFYVSFLLFVSETNPAVLQEYKEKLMDRIRAQGDIRLSHSLKNI